MLSVLPTARHPQAVAAHFPRTTTDSILSLNCDQFPTATVTALLAALPPLQSLDINNIPLAAGTPSNTTPREPSNVLLGIAEACNSPMHVSLTFGHGELYSELMAVIVSAMHANTALKHLAISKPDCESYEEFEPVSLLGLEELMGLESLTLSSESTECMQQRVVLPPDFSRLTNLTALRFSHCYIGNPSSLLAALPRLRNLRVFEFVCNVNDALNENENFDFAPGILQSAAQLPLLSELIVGRYFHLNLGMLQEFSNLRQLSLQSIVAGGLNHPDRIANSVQCMRKLEVFKMSVEVGSYSLWYLPVLDALEEAGTSHSCKQISVQDRTYGIYGPHESTSVCFNVHVCIDCSVTSIFFKRVIRFCWCSTYKVIGPK